MVDGCGRGSDPSGRCTYRWDPNSITKAQSNSSYGGNKAHQTVTVQSSQTAIAQQSPVRVKCQHSIAQTWLQRRRYYSTGEAQGRGEYATTALQRHTDEVSTSRCRCLENMPPRPPLPKRAMSTRFTTPVSKTISFGNRNALYGLRSLRASGVGQSGSW